MAFDWNYNMLKKEVTIPGHADCFKMKQFPVDFSYILMFL